MPAEAPTGLRIIAGRWRGRKLRTPPGRDLRPTADRTRTALFNILMHAGDYPPLAGAAVLDAFAGTGANGLEALSRGAAIAAFLENDRGALALIKANVATLGAEDATLVLQGDATKPGTPPRRFDIVLLDPPYRSGLGSVALAALARARWLTDDALAVIEQGSDDPFTPPDGFSVVDERRYGRAALYFLRAALPVSA